VCGGAQTKYMGKRKSPEAKSSLETDVVQCARCGLIYPDPMPHFEENEIQDNFGKPEEYFPQGTDRRLPAFANTLREIEKIKPEKGRILDVGCGRGEFLHAAKKDGWNGVGTEISKTFADYAKNKFGLNVLTGDLQDINLEPESFAVICLISVIQYLQNPIETLKKINELLKKDGVLFIEATNEDALIFKAGNFLKSITEGRKVTTHLSPLFPSYQVYGFNRRSLKAALEKAGFKVHRFKAVGIKGGGHVTGRGVAPAALNFVRKITIFFGGLIGKGHVMICIAKKGQA